MIDTKHLLKVGAAWITIVYTICYVGVALFPSLRFNFPKYGLHMIVPMGVNVTTIGTLISGLIIWNIITFLGLLLFASLFNTLKK